MTFRTFILSRQYGRARPLAIAGVIVAGIVLGALILNMDKGRHVSADDDDNAPPAKSAAADAAANPKTDAKADIKADTNPGAAAAMQPAHVTMDDAQLKASAIDVQVAGPARIHSFAQFSGEIQLNDDRTVHVVPRVAGIVESVLVSTG